jgi:uncharacterized protein (TIGR02996 family)
MSIHPDADAFIRAILRDPADVATRLVFADWLEEMGEPANVAWAKYIRLMAETPYTAGTLAFQSRKRQTRELASEIRATLTIDATRLVGHVDHFRQFLPSQNVTVTLAGHTLALSVIELVPESVARENVVIPLELNGRELRVAMADPHDRDTIQKLEFILNKEILPVTTDRDAIAAAINCCYGQSETESVDCISYEAPLVGLEAGPHSRESYGIFFTAFSQEEHGRTCNGFELFRNARGAVVVYCDGSKSIGAENHSRGVFTQLLDHFLSLPADASYTADDCDCLDFDIPLLSGRRFPATLERREGDANWFRVRFRWQDRE